VDSRVSLVVRGLSYPQTRRAQAFRVVPRGTLTRAQLLMLEGAGEEELTRFVKARAKLHGWQGIHVRDSEGVMESLHMERIDGYSEAYGVPDWRFWHEGLRQTFDAELKGASGHVQPRQKREIASMRRGGIVCFTWWPKDAETIERIFAHGLEAA
jgi:hypothetical protein